jgi:hypothetical protein
MSCGIIKVNKVVYFNAILFGPVDIEHVREVLRDLLGPEISKTDVFPFSHTHYYDSKMHLPLHKYFASYDVIESPANLPLYKRILVDIEKAFTVNNKRFVNIDVGYLALEKIVVASTKNFSHRLYLGMGVYGDLQFLRLQKKYKPLDWTFPDYKENFVLHFFENMRNFLLERIK